MQVDFGVESGSQRILKFFRARTPKERIVKAFRTAQSVGLRTCATFIIGSPEEELDDLEQSFALAKELRADFTAFYYATPYPGTKLYDLAIANKWLPEQIDFDENWVHRQPNKPVLTINFTADELIAHRKRMANPFFLRNFVRLRNVPFYAELLWAALRYPATIPEALARPGARVGSRIPSSICSRAISTRSTKRATRRRVTCARFHRARRCVHESQACAGRHARVPERSPHGRSAGTASPSLRVVSGP